jgi:hypothetical protein
MTFIRVALPQHVIQRIDNEAKRVFISQDPKVRKVVDISRPKLIEIAVNYYIEH